MKILKEHLIKLVNLLVFFGRSEIFYRDHLFYKSINLFLDIDYGDIIYDKASIVSFQQKLESIQYIAALAITGAYMEPLEIKFILSTIIHRIFELSLL